ncbi:hypothetical protein [Halalkalibacterium ligniniphilum]|uniref:hypothetical protein n=1 Tax=Halalkalibacterium ligniniphilum TaxID=1134413 RepID=UPI0003483F5E|nr:hypothetical protein [Halalkalibacterium ligniniphilum]
MAIKIQTEKTVIPVEIGELNFEFNVSDEAIKNLRKNAKIVQEEFVNINDAVDEEKSEKAAKTVLQKGFDLLLGEGAFEKIYAQTPSIIYLMKYFIQLSEGIDKELKTLGIDASQKEKVKKYLNKK